jgi:hypothetical protein
MRNTYYHRALVVFVVIFFGVPSMVYADTPSSSPLLYLPFDTNFLGATGEAPVISATASLTLRDGGINKNAITLPITADLRYSSESNNFNATTGTISLWFKPLNWHGDGQFGHSFFDIQFNCTNIIPSCVNGMTLAIDNYRREIWFAINDYQGAWDPTSVKRSIYAYGTSTTLYGWHHLVATWETTQGSRLYFDGVLVASNTQPFLLASPKSDLIFANSTTTSLGKFGPNATIDELAIFPYAKTSEEIAADYQALKDPSYLFRTSDQTNNFMISSARVVGTLLDHIDTNIIGQDGGGSILLKGQQKSIWSFGDTSLASGRVVFGSTWAESDDQDASDGINLHFKKDQNGEPVQLSPSPAGDEQIVWPGATNMFSRDGKLFTDYIGVKLNDPVKWIIQIGQGLARSISTISHIDQLEFVRTNAYWLVNEQDQLAGPGKPIYDAEDYVYFSALDPRLINNQGTILSKVAKADVENKDAYQYWNGTSWVLDRTQAVNILPADTYRNMPNLFTFGWNEYLHKWLMVYGSNNGKTIVMRIADDIVGPWSEAKVLVDCPPMFASCYFGNWHSEYDKESGKTIYLTTSNWQRYKIYLMEFTLDRLPMSDVTALTPVVTPTRPRPTSSVTFGTTLKNQGNASTVTTYAQLRIDLDNDGAWDFIAPDKVVSPITPGAFQTIRWSRVWKAVEGTHRAEICSNSNQFAFEFHRENDCTELVFTVSPGLESYPQEADLAIQGLAFSTRKPVAGKPLSIYSYIKNQGNSTVSTVTTRLRIDFNNNGTWDFVPPERYLSSLNIKATRAVIWTRIWTPIVGTHKLEVCADSQNNTDESQEDNNCSSVVFVVPYN